jgi:signal transduction histidine kinase/ActR/RegA family two-component response regulator
VHSFRATSIRAYLLQLMLVGLLAVALFAAVLLLQLWAAQRDQVRAQHEGAVHALSGIVERQIESAIVRLQVLASSPLLRRGDLREFRARSHDFLMHSADWQNILMIAPDGERLIDLTADPPPPTPAASEAHRRAVLDTRKPAVSDVFETAATHENVVEIAVPVLEGDRVRYILAATLDLGHLEWLLLGHIEKGGVAALLDRQRMIVARSRGGREYVGKPPVRALYEQVGSAPRGWARFVAFEGDPVYTAWAPVGGSGWTIAVGIPAAAIEQSLMRSLALLGGLGLLVFAATGWLGIRAARRAAAGIDSAAVAAQDVAAGRPVNMPTTGIAEFDSLGAALRAAGSRLAHEADVRAQAENERNALLERERDARARAEAESRAKDEFLAMLGHELRNPLAAISTAAQVLRRAGKDAPEGGRALEIIARQAAHQGRLLDDLLDVARVVTGKITLERVPLELAECARRALAALDASGKTGAHALEARLEPVWVSGDAARLEQVVANLVGNALKFTPAGGAIRVSTAREGDAALIRVEDTGVGIDAGLLPRIFELFAQGEQESARSAGGLGVGLTLVRRIAELHGGRAEACSPGAGRGATFTIRLPAIAAPIQPLSVPDPPGRLPPRRILLVEDNSDAREMLRIALIMEGHEVQAVADGTAALAGAGLTRPDVAIIDIGLPGMDGYELALRLRAQLGPGLRLIALSGYGLPDDLRRSHRAGFEAHLVKPVDPARLAALLAGEESPARRDAAA